jgi:hypothetical protein
MGFFSRFNTDRIVGLSAMVVGVSSLAVTGYQATLERQTQHASVMPYLYIQLSVNDNGVNLMLTNSGIGPALIDDVRVSYQGKQIVGDPYDFYTGLKLPPTKTMGVDKVLPGRLIPAGATITMLGFGPVDRERMVKELLGLFEIAEVPRSWYENAGTTNTPKAVIEIGYSSVYGDQWRVRSDRIVPESQ